MPDSLLPDGYQHRPRAFHLFRRPQSKESPLSAIEITRAASALTAADRVEGVSAPQMMRLAMLVLLVAFCIGLSTARRAGHEAEPGPFSASGAMLQTKR